MVLVTNLSLAPLLRCSGFPATAFSMSVCYDTLDNLISKQLKDTKSAEVYWDGDTDGICNVLRRHGITPVNSVNVIQKGMSIISVVSDNCALLYHITGMRN